MKIWKLSDCALAVQAIFVRLSSDQPQQVDVDVLLDGEESEQEQVDVQIELRAIPHPQSATLGYHDETMPAIRALRG